MYRLLIAFVLSFSVAASAQPLQPLSSETSADQPESYILHVTDWLNRQPAAQRALADFHRRKALGLLSRTPTVLAPPQVGDRQSFKVYNFETQTTELREFELRVIEERFYLWVEVASLDSGWVTDAKLEALRSALADATPTGSINPNQGIIANVEDVFGNPPNVDGDGKTDVLLVDIRDGWDPQSGGGFVAGFVYSGDLSPSGNNRDILYLDTNPSLSTNRPIQSLLSTAAHEYQHLIHFNYDIDEISFVNEGLSEWAEVINGYERRAMRYLSDVARYNVPIFRWSQDNVNVLDDYERAGLFTTYLEDRIGWQAVGAITRDAQSGLSSYQNALAPHGLSFYQVLLDFHTANFLNNRNVNAAYGYSRTDFQNVGAIPSVVYNGRITTQTPDTTILLWGGGVLYLVWQYVKDLQVTLSGASLALRALRYPEGGGVIVEDLNPAASPFTFSGSHNQVVLIVTRTSTSASSQVTYSATWSSDQTFTSQIVQFDNGEVMQPFIRSNGVELLTRFENPQPGYTLLGRVFLPLYFYSQFGNGPPATAPRDFTLTVRAAQPDGTPGDVLFEQTLNDPRPYQGVTSFTISFAEIDLFPYATQIGDLPDVLFIGYRDAGTDTNTIVLATSSYTVENRSFIGPLQGSWRALWETTLSDGTSLNGRIIPIRLEFLVGTQPVPAEPLAELPRELALEPPYPNPFRTTALLRYHLPKSGPVRLRIFDLLGRQVALLVDGPQPAGTHTVRLDVRGWASGLYLCVLETDGQRRIQRLQIVR
ncbi:Por secretion system C-terminal sorting domain-containing protein [Rhodothermus profundi]|uniref:Por secretion system C-terminal sorting domain-containing protein n=1 Tax=Rhodothermus profundi TaxID=633813 RepID=A0A1M6TUJ3_9BACT|nr:Por secretion system C-terminal sorting domain-containing protein [Rhodothermus profundi]